MNPAVDKRKRINLTKDERSILKSLFFKALVPIALIIIVNLTVLFFGLHFLMRKTSFVNYGITPDGVLTNVSQFISSYTTIALTNIFLIVVLSIIVLYLALQNTVLPLMRITRVLKQRIESNSKERIIVRYKDRLFIPIVELINRLLEQK